MRLGLLDVGSTAARLELADLDRSRVPRASWSYKAKTQLAEHTRADGRVTQEGIETAARAVGQCMRAGRDKAPHFVVAYGTSAVRDALNSGKLRERLGAAAGVRIGVLSPRDEAVMTYHAAHRWAGRTGTNLSTVDIGGGTSDVATGDGPYPEEVASLPVGAASLTRCFLLDDPPTPHQMEKLLIATRETVEPAVGRYAGYELGHMVGLSKLLRQLAVLTGSTPGSFVRCPDVLNRSEIQQWIPRLATLDQAGRAELPGISRSRARRFVAGAVLAEIILATIGVETLEICPWGLREGLVFRFMEAYEAAGERARDEAIRATTAEMFG